MRSWLINLVCLFIAIVAIGWLLLELLAVTGLQETTGTAAFEVATVALAKTTLLVGFLVLLYLLHKHLRRKYIVKQQFQCDQGMFPDEMQPPREIGFTQVGIDSYTTSAIDIFSSPEDESSLSSNSSLSLNSDEFHSGDALKESRLLMKNGKIDESIALLLTAFYKEYSDHNSIATELMRIINSEIQNSAISKRRLEYLFSKRDKILKKISGERGKFSDEVWLRMHTAYPDKIEADYSELDVSDVLKTNSL